MNPLTRFPLRAIAEQTIDRHLGRLDPWLRADLATSLARQWLTNDGHAGLVFLARQCWFDAAVRGDRTEVGFRPAPGDWGRALVDHWRVSPADVPDLLHRLNLCQAARQRAADGRTVCLRVEPHAHVVRCRHETAGEDEGPGA
jgi:hypothetical protein